MTSQLLAVVIFAAVALGFSGRAQAVVNMLSSDGRVYLSCVVRKVDSDVAVRGQLLTAVARQRLRAKGSGYTAATDADERAWIKLFNKRVATSCGPVPKYPVSVDVYPPTVDQRPDAVRAVDLVSSWSNRIGLNSRGQLVWRKK